jgi:hypothetical protein
MHQGGPYVSRVGRALLDSLRACLSSRRDIAMLPRGVIERQNGSSRALLILRL